MYRATPEGVEQSNYSGFHTAALVSKHTQLRLQCRTHLNNVRKQRATWDEFYSIFWNKKKKTLTRHPRLCPCFAPAQTKRQTRVCCGHSETEYLFVVHFEQRPVMGVVWVFFCRRRCRSAAPLCAAAILRAERSGEIWK